MLQLFKLNIFLTKSAENAHIWLQFVAKVLVWNFLLIKFSFGKTLPKYFWEVGELSDDSSKTEYISLAMSLSNAITLVLFIR